MFGIDLDALWNNPAIVRMAAKSSGIQAARLDIDPASGELLASLRVHGKVTQHKIPTGKTFTADEILAMLFSDPTPGQKAPTGLSGTSGKSPP
jgi:hypothetical protein